MVHQRLLEIAIREFAEKGFDGVSTRDIAAAAGTAMSSITYHYGGKDGLYLAAAEYIAGQMYDFPVEYGTDAIIAAGDAEQARGAIKAMLGRLADDLASHANEAWSLFIMREQMNPSEGFERIYAGPMGRTLETLVELVCVATGTDRETASIAVLTLFGQVIVLRGGRATCAKLVGGDCAEPRFVARFGGQIVANIDAILRSLAIDNREHA